jgi:hypothetical protein
MLDEEAPRVGETGVSVRSSEPAMMDGAAMTEAGDAVAGADPRLEVVTSLEQRVRRLEDAVATFQDTHQLEERVLERLSRSAPVAAPAAVPGPSSTGLLIDVGRRMLPAAVDVINSETAQADAHARQGPRSTRPAWLLVEMYAEARAMLHMYTDPRYRLTWAARLVPLVLLAAILTSWVWFPGMSVLASIPIVPTVLIKAVDLVLAYFLYKVLTREAARYRATAPDLPSHLRP